MNKLVVSILVIVILAFSAIGVLSVNGFLGGTGTNQRPKSSYCIGSSCVTDTVFEDLPKYPENFQAVHALFYPEPYLGMTENFSVKYPDEYYWKQPEFYANDWKEIGLQYYTTKKMTFSAGTGPYPGDMMVSNITVNDTFPAMTYWHASWAMPKYQLFKLVPIYPENSTIRMGDYKVVQDPTKAESCFDVNVIPKNIMLEPTYPKFFYDWTQKIVVEITAKCKGNWVIQMMPTDPDPTFEKEQIRELGIFNVAQIRQGGIWQIFISVD